MSDTITEASEFYRLVVCNDGSFSAEAREAYMALVDATTECPACEGAGEIEYSDGEGGRESDTCDLCEGTGTVPFEVSETFEHERELLRWELGYRADRPVLPIAQPTADLPAAA